jgi:Leucine-rich repeat (LRR) protein
VKKDILFAQFEEKFTQCTLKNVHYITGKGLKFSNSSNDIAYAKMRVTFVESSAETIPQIFYTFTNLEILEMNRVGLRNIFTSNFQRASNLRVFHAYGNRLTKLDAHSFAEAPQLEYLDLSQNKISNIDVNAFRGCGKLRELSLTDNKISIIDEQTFAPLKNLTWIWLDRNELRIVSLNMLVSNQKLIGVNLNNNPISAFSAVLLDRLPSLKYLYMEGNNCTSNTFVNTVVAGNTNIKLQLATCYQVGKF